MDLLADLNPAQREAVMHGEGPLLILAGAGSGKTRVITRRVAYLLEQGVRPYNLLAITFTNKAAGEMRQRIDKLVPGCKVWISTFHSLGVRLLRQYADHFNLDRNFTIYDQDDRVKLVKQAMESANVDSTRFPADRIQGAISKAKNQLLVPEAYAGKASDFFTQVVAQVYPFYEKRLRAANALDFDDLLMWPALGLKNDAELRAELDARFQHVLIDEYQDTNQAQYAVARYLSIDQPNLCVVGDPDQSIYKWRGSDIRNILDFERDFPDVRIIALEQNYRSTQAILRSASQVIANNRQRKPKRLITENPRGEPVRLLVYETGLEEADGVAQRIRQAVDAGKRRFRDCAVFLRVNALSRAVESAFVKARIPYQIVKGLAFFDRKENRDVLAYLRLLVNPRDDLSFLRVVNEPARGIGKVSLEHLKAYAEPRELSLLAAAEQVSQIPALKGKAAAGLRDFAVLMRELGQLADLPPGDVIWQVLDRSGYRKMLKESTDAEDQDRLANIEELVTAATQSSAAGGAGTIADFLENVALTSDVDGWDERQDCVSIMTLHSAKGLEFPMVFMLAVEQGLLPHDRSLQKDEDLEEERRLAFVGMTRAMEELYLCHARLREFRGSAMSAIPSMFLEELPGDEIEIIEQESRYAYADEWRGGSSAAARQGWRDTGYSRPKTREKLPPLPNDPDDTGPGYAEGMMVRHDTYGVGRVTDVSGYGAMRKIKVRFSSHGEKTFVAEKAKLAIVAKK